MEDDNKSWPPAPSTPVQIDEIPKRRSTGISSPYLRVIYVMWAVTFGQIIFNYVSALAIVSDLLGFAGFALSVYLVTRHNKAANINGALRLVLWVLGLLSHFATNR
jgi:hypothetical protein